MSADVKKNQKKWEKSWIFLCVCVILTALFSPLYTLSAKEKTEKVTAKVSLSDPETEGRLAENREKLAKLESENVRLRAENVQVKSEMNRLEEERLRLENELKLVREENSVLRMELLETLEEYSKQGEELKEMELSAAGILDTLQPIYAGARDAELLASLHLTLETGKKLLTKSLEIRGMILENFSALKLDPVGTARLRLALDEQKKISDRFAALTVQHAGPESFEGCRILELNDELKLVVVSAGYRNGIRVGMSLRAGEGSSSQLLRVVAVRPYVSGALLGSGGEWKGLFPGMPVKASMEPEANGQKSVKRD